MVACLAIGIVLGIGIARFASFYQQMNRLGLYIQWMSDSRRAHLVEKEEVHHDQCR